MAAPSGGYSLIRTSTTTATAITIQTVLAPAGTMIEFVRCWANQSTVTTSAQTRIQFVRTSTNGTVTSATPAPLSAGMQASKCVGGTAATGITATAEGTKTTVYCEEGFNIVNGWLLLPVPEERVPAINANTALYFPTAPTSAGWVSGMTWLEFAS